MKNLFLKGFVVLILCSCSKENDSPHLDLEAPTIEKLSLRTALPNELVWEDPDPTDNINVLVANCPPNNVDCGPWIDVTPQLTYFDDFVAAIEGETIIEYFSGQAWQDLFDDFDETLLSGLQNGSVTISEVEAMPDKRIFIVHYANLEANKTNCLIALPFEIND